uniref:Uncharacterized protein n=1 Tax=Oryza sativa subsp. japonica TaxID=39947 RepID=Q654F8_ORYSJ|nr:hypothetical protein [Oryza sativa Japonica Group]BAD45830.1 hypothetical protein [Oryza sativa Japonica Group]
MGRGVVGRPQIGERTRRSASHGEDLARRPHTERGAHRPTVHRRRSSTGNRAWGRSSPGSYARGRINRRTTHGERSLSAATVAASTRPQAPPAAWTAAAAATSYPAVAATCYFHFDSVAAASSLTPPQSLPTAVAASTMPPPPSPQPTLLPSLVVAATLSYHRSPHGLCCCWNGREMGGEKNGDMRWKSLTCGSHSHLPTQSVNRGLAAMSAAIACQMLKE